MWIQVFIVSLVATSALSLGDRQFYSKKTVQRQQSPLTNVKLYQQQPQQAPLSMSPMTSQQQAPSPYSFQYQADALGGQSSRQEYSDASGKVVGSYSVVNEDGSKRLVKYVADSQGFRADVDTSEPGTKSDNPADVTFKSSAPAAPLMAPKYSSAAQQKSYQMPIQQQPIQFAAGGVAKIEDEGPKPYAFSYQSQMQDGFSARSESADGSGKVVGSYGLSQTDGRQRTVDYTADQSGFKAAVKTNEFGTKSESPADVKFMSSAPLQDDQTPQKPSFAYQTPVQQMKLDFPAPVSTQFQKAAAPVQQTPYLYAPPAPARVEYGQPSPFAFNYVAQLEDGSSSRSESADGSGKVVGSYSLAVDDGRRRTVEYVADQGGFVAKVDTNEFGTKSDSPADVTLYSSAPQDFVAPQQAPVAYVAPAAYQPMAGQMETKKYQQTFQIQQQQEPIKFGIQGMADAKPSPYAFNYQNQMNGGGSSHTEASDGSGKVVGSYSLKHNDGSQRVVEYTADQGGFRAIVNTNEFGTKSDSPADVKFYSNAPEPKLQPVAVKAPMTIKAPSVAMKQSFHSQQQQRPVQFSMGNAAQLMKQDYGSRSKVEFQKAAPVQQKMQEANFPRYPYSFGYEAQATGGASSRQEAADSSGKVTGSYSVVNEDGSTRIVEYIADEGGFRANVKTNEPGTKSDSPADITLHSNAPIAQQPATMEKQFPLKTYSPKSSMISQKAIDAWIR